METSAVIVSPRTVISIVLILLYVPAALIILRRLFPSLSTPTRRLAGGFLLAQVIMILVALEIKPATALEKWIWDFEAEWNIPATFASTQLAMVAGFSILTASSARLQPPIGRLYSAGMGLLFLFLALDEYYLLHEQIHNWTRLYTVLGLAVCAATLIVAARSPRRARTMHFYLLTGLAIAGLGAIVFDFLPETCIGLESLSLSGCVNFLFLGEALELLGIWLVLVATLGLYSEVAPAPRKHGVRLAIYALPLLWIALLVLDPLVLRLEIRFLAHPSAISVESDIHIHGYRMERRADKHIVQLYASTTHREFIGLGYSIHLVDQASGESIAGRDIHAGNQLRFKLDSNFVHVYRQRLELDIPPTAPTNRALWVVLTVWRKEGNVISRREVVDSDRQLLSDTQVVLDELVLPADSSASAAKPLAIFTNGFTLDAADIPYSLHPGETAYINFAWRADTDSSVDYTQFLHFSHAESGERWGFDQQPLGPRLPTRLWYSGLADSETWAAPLPADLAPGRYAVFTGLYRTIDLERVPASDADGAAYIDARVPLGEIIVAA